MKFEATEQAESSGIYTSAWERGLYPTAAVASYFLVSKSAAAKWVARARELGLLGSTTRGKAGGVVAEKHEEEDS